MKSRLLVAGLALLVGAAAASAGFAGSRASGTVVKVAFDKKLKKSILVDSRGLTLYLFVQDRQGTSTCLNDATYHCIKIWPALLTTGAPHAGPGVKQSLLGTTKRADGGVQVTYNRHPLYEFRGFGGSPGDKKPGDTKGQGFGLIWFVVAPSGAPIHS